MEIKFVAKQRRPKLGLQENNLFVARQRDLIGCAGNRQGLQCGEYNSLTIPDYNSRLLPASSVGLQRRYRENSRGEQGAEWKQNEYEGSFFIDNSEKSM